MSMTEIEATSLLQGLDLSEFFYKECNKGHRIVLFQIKDRFDRIWINNNRPLSDSIVIDQDLEEEINRLVGVFRKGVRSLLQNIQL